MQALLEYIKKSKTSNYKDTLSLMMSTDECYEIISQYMLIKDDEYFKRLKPDDKVCVLFDGGNDKVFWIFIGDTKTRRCYSIMFHNGRICDVDRSTHWKLDDNGEFRCFPSYSYNQDALDELNRYLLLR